MNEVLPQYTGLTVNAVSYQYTAVKKAADPFVVSVQNSNALGTAYVFRSTDNWTGLPGNTITKTVPTENIPLSYWGPGQIQTQGFGSVLDPSVAYSYKYDTCKLSPVVDTSCSNYKPNIPEVKLPEQLYNTAPSFVSSEYIREEYQNNRVVLTEPAEKKPNATRSANSLVTAQAAKQAAALEALNNSPEFKLYTIALPGGVYPETLKYADKVLPDSSSSRRLNLSQQRLHTLMVESQHNLRK
jgi:hypothetical protein